MRTIDGRKSNTKINSFNKAIVTADQQFQSEVDSQNIDELIHLRKMINNAIDDKLDTLKHHGLIDKKKRGDEISLNS